MMKLSKIFKRQQEEKESLPKGIKPEAKEEELGGHEAGAASHATGDTRNVKISSVLNKELEKISEASTSQLYAEILAKVKHIYKADLAAEPNFIPKLNPLIEKIVATLQSGNDEIILACLKDYPGMEEFLYYHVVNVCISSVAMGINLGYERPHLVELGVAALVHDIGTRSIEVGKSPEIFTGADHEKMKRHPDEGATILSKIDPGMSQRILDAVRQEHERADGSGYPQGLTADDINEYAQIIGLADVYEAMMHQRPYRDKYSSLETIRIILKNKKIFSRKVTKTLIETFGIFPVDTLVQLNTKEIAVVVKPNPELISRPVIDVLIDSYGKELKQPKRVNMAENPVIYIDNCVKTQPA
jgi:HD-GYP domain-containing protein (c-di-GMP phosphodiesterase class II)